MKEFTSAELQPFQDLIELMVVDQDIPAYRAAAVDLGLLAADADFGDELVGEYFRHFYEFVMTDEVSVITDEYASASVRRFFDISGPYGEIMKKVNLPPSFVVVQRINLGLYALFARIGAEANWRRISEEIWPFVNGPPSTPMGEAEHAWLQAKAAARNGARG